LAGDEFIVHDNCLMMFHNYTGGVFGKGHEQIAALDATTRWVHEVMKNVYVPFMTEVELDRLTKGEDLYFRADEVRKRLVNMVKTIEKELKAAKPTTPRKRKAKVE